MKHMINTAIIATMDIVLMAWGVVAIHNNEKMSWFPFALAIFVTVFGLTAEKR